MNPFITRHFILLISSVLLFFTTCDAFCFLRTDVHLNITNQLGSGLDLTVQCKSRDDDLGVHVVPFDGKLHWFDIFIAERDSHRCGDCTWRILPEGPCMTCNIGESKEYVCYQWNGELF
ncbi:hypothetical protein BDE02_18G123100 [Populus trichocarpa]|nr:hypothetical protein BDE02_18G123100 [Populus trichocarpa]